MICPHCRAEHKDDPRNKPGAVDICVVCGCFYVHTSDGPPRAPGMAEAKNIAANPGCQRIRQAWERTQRQIGNQVEGGEPFTF